MTEHRETLMTLLKILLAIGAFEGLKISWKYIFTNKREKTKSISELYGEFTKNTSEYMKQTEEMQGTITELRNNSIAMEKRIIEMDKKLDEKNQIILSLKNETHLLTERTKQNTKVITELLDRAKLLESIKCEREDCNDRIPPKSKKSIGIGKAKA